MMEKHYEMALPKGASSAVDKAAKEFFEKVYVELEKITDWKAVVIGDALVNLAKKLEIKNSQFFADMRMVITGKKVSPPLNESMEILGKAECLKRIKTLTN